MKELIYDAKIAVIKLLNEILNADEFVRESEVEYMNDIIHSFELNDGYISDVDNMVTLQALSIIRELPIDIKNEVAKMLGKMIVVDKDINYNEVRLYNAFCESCNINNDFNIQDYPEYTLSGPFVNPEDLI